MMAEWVRDLLHFPAHLAALTPSNRSLSFPTKPFALSLVLSRSRPGISYVPLKAALWCAFSVVSGVPPA
jgi:hypothetical protein